jgi:hypothetical protein
MVAALLVAKVLLSLAATPPASTRQDGPLGVVAQGEDRLFEATLRELERDTLEGGIRVDPKPLRPDPGLATLRALTMVPDRVSQGSWSSPYAESSPDATRARQAVLSRLGIPETDGLGYADCPGVLVPPTPIMVERKRSHCPAESFRAVLVALPRQGGAYWPQNFDERPKYDGRDVWSVRVIVKTLSPNGQVERSADYVFERVKDAWVLLERRLVLIVE